MDISKNNIQSAQWIDDPITSKVKDCIKIVLTDDTNHFVCPSEENRHYREVIKPLVDAGTLTIQEAD
tara:strand:- start:145 stop:345 length:201 start_codon:yes stop_codon:yes gene_type:complete